MGLLFFIQGTVSLLDRIEDIIDLIIVFIVICIISVILFRTLCFLSCSEILAIFISLVRACFHCLLSRTSLTFMMICLKPSVLRTIDFLMMAYFLSLCYWCSNLCFCCSKLCCYCSNLCCYSNFCCYSNLCCYINLCRFCRFVA